MKCEKHGCEMESRRKTIGWGSVDELVCPECEEEATSRGFGSAARVYPAVKEVQPQA